MPLELSDLQPLLDGEVLYIDFARHVTIDDLRALTNASIDMLKSFLDGLTDAHVTFEPVDPHAHDPYAVDGEEQLGWNLAHLVLHVTASSEEGAAMSATLARGIEVKLRSRYEPPWREYTTVEQCLERLEESRRMRLAFLDAWPNSPHLDVYRKISKEWEAKVGKLNAPAMFLFGLLHEVGHYDQFREVRRQALAAYPLASH